MKMTRVGLTAALGAAVLGAAACSRPAAPADGAGDDALRRDLEAAQSQAAVDTRPTRTQFVSPLELGRAADRAAPAAARSAPRPTTAAKEPARSAPRTTRVARVARPAPARVAAPASTADAPHEPDAEAPNAPIPVEAPVPEPPRDEPIVAAPSRPADPTPPPPRRRGPVWTTGDVIRNAPFPINP